MPTDKNLRMLVQVEKSPADSYNIVAGVYYDKSAEKYADADDAFSRIDSNSYLPQVAEYNGFRVSAMVGHSYRLTSDDTPGEVWGWEYSYAPDRITRPEVARGMASVLARVEKGLDKIDSEAGVVSDFAGYVARIASVLRMPLYVRNTARRVDMTGESFSLMDAGKLRYWVQDVSAAGEKRDMSPMRPVMSSTSRI